MLERRYRPARLQDFGGRCDGLEPVALRGGRGIYKHFACSVRVRLNSVNFTDAYRVHVVGRRGQIVLGAH